MDLTGVHQICSSSLWSCSQSALREVADQLSDLYLRVKAKSVFAAAASKRTFTTKASSFLTINKFVSSVISKQARSPFVKDLPSSIRVAAFHASERRSILPPLPRELPLPSNDYPIANSLPETIDGTGKTRLA
jgi:hypothetical protein